MVFQSCYSCNNSVILHSHQKNIVSWAVFNLVYNWMKIRDRNLKNRIFHGVYLVGLSSSYGKNNVKQWFNKTTLEHVQAFVPMGNLTVKRDNFSNCPWELSSVLFCLFSSPFSSFLFQMYVELEGEGSQSGDYPSRVFLKLRHLSGSYFRDGNGNVREFRQPLGSWRTLEFDRFAITNTEGCNREKAKGNSK